MDETLNQLELTLSRMLVEHEALLTLLRRKREAIRAAKPSAVTACCGEENRRVQQIAELEKQRQRLAADLTLALEAEAARPMRLSEIVGRLDEPRRSELRHLQGKLRERVEAVRDEARIAREATEGLLQHMHGVMQTIVKTVTRHGTYGQKGMKSGATAVVSSFSAEA